MKFSTLQNLNTIIPHQFIKQLHHRRFNKQPNKHQPHASQKTASSESKRLISLDAFRGLTILGMLLVNNMTLGQATPQQLTHAAWNEGVHFADLVFPWFLFIVGVAIPYSVHSFQKKKLPYWRYLYKVINRAVVLILLGCLIDSSIARQPIIGLGVLQLIGLTYLVSSILYKLPIAPRLATAALLLLGHWAAIRYLGLPNSNLFTEDQNLITYINHTYLEPYHLKGLISVVPTTSLALIGTAIGDWLRQENDSERKKLTRLFISGALLVGFGWLWDLDLPFNKSVWTASYILYTAGLATLTLGFFYFTIDLKKWRIWVFPLVVFGSNAILAYVLPILVKVNILQNWMWKQPGGTIVSIQQALQQELVSKYGSLAGGWCYTVLYLAFWWLILATLYRKKIFLRV